MGMSYDTALISTAADVARLTGVQRVQEAFVDGDTTVDLFLLEASRWVFERLRGAGVDPTKLTNEARLERAVAFYALGMLAEAGHLSPGEGTTPAELADRYHERAKEAVDHFRPILTSGDEPRRASEAIPAVGHMDGRGLVFGGGVYDDLPRVF